MMCCEDVSLVRTLPLSEPSSGSDLSEGPLSPFSALHSWQSHSATCAKEGTRGALLCNGGCSLLEYGSMAKVQVQMIFKGLLKAG